MSALEPQVTTVIPSEGLEHAGVEGADAAAEAAEVEAGSGGDDDHGGDAEFEERGVVGEQRGCVGLAGARM